MTSTTAHILEPGLWRADPYLERYTVSGGGSIVFELFCEDSITIIDPEGSQPGELIAFDNNGQPDCAGLSGNKPIRASGFQQSMSAKSDNTQQVLAGLKRRNIDPSQAKALALFPADTSPGTAVDYTARKDLVCVVCAPGGPMMVDQQMPPTSLVVQVRRSRKRDLTEPPLPEPLAEPRLELRVDRCTAGQYTVHAGEYIQIIDVAGRECSDFLAFSRAALDRGKNAIST